MKYITGIILGIVLASGAVVYAKSSGIEYTKTLNIQEKGMLVHKIYDNDNGVVCYVAEKKSTTWTSPGISCVN